MYIPVVVSPVQEYFGAAAVPAPTIWNCPTPPLRAQRILSAPPSETLNCDAALRYKATSDPKPIPPVAEVLSVSVRVEYGVVVPIPIFPLLRAVKISVAPLNNASTFPTPFCTSVSSDDEDEAVIVSASSERRNEEDATPPKTSELLAKPADVA